MTKTISTSDVGPRLAELLESVADGDEVVLERQGEPAFVVVRASEFEALRDVHQRWDAYRRLEALRACVRARNLDLTDELAEELADRAIRDAIDSLAERGALTFEDDQR